MFKKILSTFFTRFFIALSNLGVAILLSNFIGAAGRGEQSLIITLITLILIITGIIGSASISYLLPRYHFLILYIPSCLWVCVIVTACYFILPFFNLIPERYTVDVCILSLVLGIFTINVSVLVSRQRIQAANFLSFIQSFILIMVLVILFLVFKRKGIQSYITALYIAYSASFIISLAFIHRYFYEPLVFSWFLFYEGFRKLAVLGFYNQIAVFTQLLSFRLSYYILDAYEGKSAVGIYSNAVSVAESIWLIGRSIAMVQHSKIVNSNNNEESLRLTAHLNGVNIIISVVLLLILCLVPSEWYVFIFGREFTNINGIILTLSPGILFFGIALILGYYFSSTGRHYVNAIASTAGLIVTVVLGYTLVPLYHSYGAGITSSISYGITALVVVYFYVREKKRMNF